MKTFKAEIQHDTGTFTMCVSATSEQTAIHKIMEAEGCPDTAIKSIVEVEGLTPEQKIIKAAKHICETSFMDYPDYDPELPLSLEDAMTILMMERLNEGDIPSECKFDDSQELYDFLDNH